MDCILLYYLYLSILFYFIGLLVSILLYFCLFCIYCIVLYCILYCIVCCIVLCVVMLCCCVVCEVSTNFVRGVVVSWLFQFSSTVSHVRSFRILYRVGSLGFFVANKYPRYLKVTISPLFGVHRLTNSDVPAGATKRIPFGLVIN